MKIEVLLKVLVEMIYIDVTTQVQKTDMNYKGLTVCICNSGVAMKNSTEKKMRNLNRANTILFLGQTILI